MAKKKNTQKLELEDIKDEKDLFANAAILTIRTPLSGPQFVWNLNRCAHLDLNRMDLSPDEIAALEEGSYHFFVPFLFPIYSYHDELSGLKYYVIDAWYYKDMPKELWIALKGCDKIVFFVGLNAYEPQQEFYKRLSSLNKFNPKGDFSQCVDGNGWNALADNVADINYFDFSDNDCLKSSQWQSASEPYSSKLKKTITTIKNFFTDIICMIDECEYAVDCYKKMSKGF